MRASIGANQLATASAQLPVVSISNTNNQLYLLERARIAFLAGDYKKSKTEFNRVYANVEKEQDAARFKTWSRR